MQRSCCKRIGHYEYFFDHSISQAIKKDFGMADLIIGNNVLAHVPAPGDLVAGIAALLHPEGHVVMEVPHLLTLINHIEFDTIFHQHYSYFSLDSAEVLFRKHGLYLNDVEQIPVHGGSIRLFFSWREGASDNVIAVKKAEREGGLRQISVYRDLQEK
ncbi:unnamed protein product [Sphagnum jensenii]|uniref:Methyltransferase type 11 domain-containing protein n=1 Tax=Sphagnum jensenii TaxID=128206 RepID=A0ABP0V658_9BRYO